MKNEIYKYIEKFGPIRPSVIRAAINTSEVTLFKILKELIEDDKIKKDGRDNGVFYYINNNGLYITNNNKENSKDINKDGDKEKKQNINNIKDYDKYTIDKNYIYIDPAGNIMRGFEGFVFWCYKSHLNIEIETKNFIKIINDTNKIKQNGLIKAKENILSQNKNTEIFLNQIFYSDFYNVAHFGKTKLGQLVYIAKTSQNKTLIKEVVKEIHAGILNIIESKNIKYIAYIPPTVKRKTQFIFELEKYLHLTKDFDLIKLKIEKIKSDTLIPQKTLKKLEDRVYNASHTIIVSPNQSIDGNVLLIDDATGSGSTLNETAKKIKKITDCKVYGYSIVGSMKGFDVINEI